MEAQMTPKQRYDATMENVRKEKLKTQGIDPDENKELDDLVEQAEKEIDKNLGEAKIPQKFTMTQEDFQKRKMIEDQKAMIGALTNAQTDKLTKEERQILEAVLAKFEAGTLIDPVMIHLIEQRGKTLKAYKESVQAIRDLERKLLEDISKCTNAMVKAKGVLENVNQQILEIHEKADGCL